MARTTGWETAPPLPASRAGIAQEVVLGFVGIDDEAAFEGV
jgi:hypothetical protein